MKYASGESIMVGDHVLIEGGKTPAIVDVIVDTAELMDEFELDNYGVLVKSEPFGGVFWPDSDEDAIKLVSRGD